MYAPATFLAKLATDGTWQWAITGGGFDSKGLTSCGLGEVCGVGTFTSSVTFGSLPTLNSNGAQDIYLVKAGNTADVPVAGEWLTLSGVSGVAP